MTTPATFPAASLVQSWIRAFNERDLPAMLSLYAADAELFDSGMRHPRKGLAEIETWFRVRFGTMPGNVYAPRGEIRLEEHEAVVPWTLKGHSPRLLGQAWLSHPLEIDGTSYFTFREGKIYRQRGLYDHLAALRQTLPVLQMCPAFVARLLYSLYLRRHNLW